ncbi:hydroxyacylglutathione hydrolase [Sansalvadorimonas verongulae]|uniref:hydroxyacylglutathione hydrolase n=1 Tax=Sansalvadorimonas verongulae TaxID=2172824 RepID=UPI0012BD024F|nr:hydroxyacylglutathione hydrolase [Sansalvadorimonas verongulae]MTI14652.1 hydroxyacylglutathione hydrolase [Sansalvadorimonas verongulae]
MLSIRGLQAFNDNYIWMLADSESRTCYVVDPGDASVVEAACRQTGYTLAGILITHHHADHTGGLRQLASAAAKELVIYGPASESIPGITHPLSEGDTFTIAEQTFTVIDTPGHTSGGISYFAQLAQPVLFSGDTLFAGGCGRLLEGTPAQMLKSLNKLTALPSETLVYCAHEYTQSNLAFALAVEPDNSALKQRVSDVQQLREQGQATVPSTLDTELRTNPFLRASIPDVQEAASRHSGRTPTSAEDTFAIIRQWKDNF